MLPLQTLLALLWSLHLNTARGNSTIVGFIIYLFFSLYLSLAKLLTLTVAEITGSWSSLESIALDYGMA